MSIPSALPRLALVALLAAAPTASGAQWEKVGGSSRLDLYIDRASITREGARVQALVRTEWAEPQQAARMAYRSSLARDEFDCDEHRSRTLELTLYPQSNLAGAPVRTGAAPSARWSAAGPGTMAENTLKTVCGLR
jgi:hypothetical protein